VANELDGTLCNLKCTATVYALASTSQTLSDEVMNAVQDASVTYDRILELFNDCMFELAGEFLLPDLEAWADLNTSATASYIQLPADYMRNLRHCHSTTYNREIKVYGSLTQLYRKFSNLDQTGNIVGVAPKGRNLYYQRLSAETLRINYYKYPEKLQTREDKPVEIPWHLAKPLLKHYALKELYSEIEDGIEGQQVNTERHSKEYEKYKEKLWMFIGPEERDPQQFLSEEIPWDVLV